MSEGENERLDRELTQLKDWRRDVVDPALKTVESLKTFRATVVGGAIVVIWFLGMFHDKVTAFFAGK